MNTDEESGPRRPKQRSASIVDRFICVYLCSFRGSIFSATGCGKPSAGILSWRKQNQTLRENWRRCTRRASATPQRLRRSSGAGATTVPMLPHERLEELFTVTA